MNFLQVTVLLVALFASAYAMNSTWGQRNTTDVLLLNENVFRTAMNNSYLSVDVVFPKSGETNNRTITAIYVYDYFTNSTGATGSLWSGGPGYRFATINLKSQYGRGINSSVQIYGK